MSIKLTEKQIKKAILKVYAPHDKGVRFTIAYLVAAALEKATVGVGWTLDDKYQIEEFIRKNSKDSDSLFLVYRNKSGGVCLRKDVSQGSPEQIRQQRIKSLESRRQEFQEEIERIEGEIKEINREISEIST